MPDGSPYRHTQGTIIARTIPVGFPGRCRGRMPLTLYVSPKRDRNLKGVRKKIPHAFPYRSQEVLWLRCQSQGARASEVARFLQFALTDAEGHQTSS